MRDCHIPIIYCIQCIITKKRYVGQAIDGQCRWNDHVKGLRRGKHKNRPPCSEETRRKLSKANGGENNWMYGKHHTKRTKRKMSDAQKGKKLSNAHRKNISKARKGMKFSLETKQKMSEARRGKKLSNEHKRKMRQAWDKRKALYF